MSELELLRLIADQATKINKLEEEVRYSAKLYENAQSKLEETLKELNNVNEELNKYKVAQSKFKEECQRANEGSIAWLVDNKNE